MGLKQVACPHCGRNGTLVGHGRLCGYAEREAGRAVRGQRFLCSNRFRRPGCGRTFSVLFAAFFAGFLIGAETLWRFAQRVVAIDARRSAWLAVVGDALSVSSGYRLWHRLSQAQPLLRSELSRLCPPPVCTDDEPLARLLAHFQAAFPMAGCPLAAFQLWFQRGVLG